MTGAGPLISLKCLEVDTISGFKYISEPIHFRNMVYLKDFYLSRAPGQKPGGGATGQLGGGWTQKFDDNIQNSSGPECKSEPVETII
jgi:hypothetical protein